MSLERDPCEISWNVNSRIVRAFLADSKLRRECFGLLVAALPCREGWSCYDASFMFKWGRCLVSTKMRGVLLFFENRAMSAGAVKLLQWSNVGWRFGLNGRTYLFWWIYETGNFFDVGIPNFMNFQITRIPRSFPCYGLDGSEIRLTKNQLRLVVEIPLFTTGFIHVGWLVIAGFLPAWWSIFTQVVHLVLASHPLLRRILLHSFIGTLESQGCGAYGAILWYMISIEKYRYHYIIFTGASMCSVVWNEHHLSFSSWICTKLSALYAFCLGCRVSNQASWSWHTNPYLF